MEKKRFPAKQEIVEEHCSIRTIAKWIEFELTRQPESHGEELSERPLLGPLRTFREHLSRHFEFEEESGVLAAAIMVRPRASALLEKWRSQHERLLTLLDASIHHLEIARNGRSLDESFEQELRTFLDELYEHDDLEDELLGETRAPEFRHRQRSYEEKQV
jgi:hypothetical protein